MRRSQKFEQALFPASVVRELLSSARMIGGDLDRTWIRKISRGSDDWYFDSDEEFFSEYQRGFRSARYGVRAKSHGKDNIHELDLVVSDGRDTNQGESSTRLEVIAPQRADIEKLHNILSECHDQYRVPVLIPDPPSPRIFIGHGRNLQWRDLKDHLQDQHGYDVEAYETGARSGHVIRDILEEMLTSSSFAILVMTGEDETIDGELRARQNVIHEAGLFQGKLGFARVVMLVEEGVEMFSNVDGIQQIRFSRSNIRETFGDVLATLRREFGNSSR